MMKAAENKLSSVDWHLERYYNQLGEVKLDHTHTETLIYLFAVSAYELRRAMEVTSTDSEVTDHENRIDKLFDRVLETIQKVQPQAGITDSAKEVIKRYEEIMRRLQPELRRMKQQKIDRFCHQQ
jgi:hypothetical protein